MNTRILISRGLGARFAFKSVALAALSALALAASEARADVVYNETTNGDLSNNGLIPTVISFHSGSNQVLGTTGRGSTVDRDYFTFTIPENNLFSGIWELPGTTAGGVSFIGLQAGPQLTLPTNTQTAAGLLGWYHYDASLVNTDLFPLMSISANGSSGFTPPLSSGTYTIWIQDFTPGTYTYGFDFRVTPVPEPSTYGLVGAGLVLALAARRRFGKRAAAKA